MILKPGSPLGAYEILALLGSGGMGEVYRARDTTLGREVAVKVLSTGLVAEPSQQARFEREARALAALNHPHIAAVYGFEQIGDTRALVMELVDGDTLADRLSRGRAPLTEVFSIARQIADALEAAHDKGLVHRDLKPANIKITPGGVVKVLDFGLAKHAAGTGFDGQLPTAVEATRDGVILGTAAYMSPEQARGQPVDKRTDIWAFGCVLYDMLAGRRAFAGDTAPDIIASVLQSEPDWQGLPDSTPAAARRLVRRCLEKDPVRRLHDIADARLEIEDLLASPPAPAPITESVSLRARVRWPVVLGALAVLAIGATLGILVQRDATSAGGGEPQAVEGPSIFGMPEPPGEPLYLFADPIKISPDGRQVALLTNGVEGRPRLWLRSMDAMTPRLIENTDGATFPFWSPDGRSLAFVAQGQLRVLELASRSVRTLTPIQGSLAGGTWNREGVILFVDGMTGIKRIAATGGTATAVTSPGSSAGGVLHVSPQFLPDGRHFLYAERSLKPGQSAVMLGDLDSPARTRLLSIETGALYASPGYLLYARDGELVAHRFDVSRMALVGDPVVIGPRLWPWLAGGGMAASASETGVLAFATRRTPTTQLTWFERSGKPLGPLGDPGLWVHIEISPDEKSLAAERLDARTGMGAIWTMDVARAVTSRLSLDPAWSLVPVWSPAGDRMAFGSSREGGSDLFLKPTDGSGGDELLFKSTDLKLPTDWLPDDRGLVFNNISPTTGADIWTIPVRGDRQPTPLVQTQFNEGSGKISPDGRWLVYASNESGRPEIYVRPLDRATGRWQISRSGGSQPRWRRDGNELFFVSEEGRIMAALVSGRATLVAAAPETLPIQTERDVTGWRYSYDVADLGKRILVIRQTTSDPAPPITVLVNWQALMEK